MVAIRQVLSELIEIKSKYPKDVNVHFESYDFNVMINDINGYISSTGSKGKTKVVHLDAQRLIRKTIHHICKNDWDQKFIQKKRISQKNVKKVYDYFKEQILSHCKIVYEKNEKTKKTELKNIKKINPVKIEHLIQALKSIMFITMTVNKREEAYELFERTNARGKELDVADLLKNHLFTKKVTLEDQSGEERDLFDVWDEIIDNCDEKILRLLKYFHSTQGGYTTNKRLYRKLKVVSEPDPKQFLEKLCKYSEFAKYMRICASKSDTQKYFKTLLDEDDTKIYLSENRTREITESIVGLDHFGVTQYHPVFYSVIAKFHDFHLFRDSKYHDYIPRFIQILENYHFVNTAICETVAHDIEVLYAQKAMEITQAKNKAAFEKIVNDLIKTLDDKLLTEDEFIASFKTLNYSTAYRRLYYIFDRFNSFDLTLKDDKNLKKPKRLDTRSWEQIYIRGKSYSRQETTAEHWRNQNEGEGYEAIHSIGNLIYLPRRINTAKINNLKTSEKLGYFKNNPNEVIGEYLKYFLKKYEPNLETWGNEDIEKHATDLAKLAYNVIWKSNPVLVRKKKQK